MAQVRAGRCEPPRSHRARWSALVACPALLLPNALVAWVPAQEPPALAFVGATVIDGNGGPPLEDATLVVEGGRIWAVGPSDQVSVPEGARVIDAEGRYLVPGFIDTNAHLSLYGGSTRERRQTLALYADRNEDLVLESAQLHLKHGVTTVLDSYGVLGPLMKVRDAIENGATGSRMLVAGNVMGWGGPCSVSFSMIPESDCTPLEERFNDEITLGMGEELMAMTLDELRSAVSAYLDSGPDFLKFSGTSHFDPVFIGFSPEAQRIMVEEAHARGLRAQTHSTSIEGLRLSVLAGIDLIQHPEHLGEREIPDWLVDMIRDRGIVCSMFTNAYTGEAWQEHLRERDAALSSAARQREARQAMGREATSAELRRERQAAGIVTEMRRRNAGKLIRGGCTATVGTDAYLGAAPELRRAPLTEREQMGLRTIVAIEGLVELGMTPSEALVAATRNGALAAGALDSYGTLEEGKLADLLVLDGDPTANIANIRKLGLVVKSGFVVDTEALPTRPIWFGR